MRAPLQRSPHAVGQPVAKTIVDAVVARKPKRRYIAGSGIVIFGVLAHLPASLHGRQGTPETPSPKLRAPAGANPRSDLGKR